MNVTVTGGAGYIGAVLVPLLIKLGHKVTVIDNLYYGGTSLLPNVGQNNFNFIKADIRDEDKIKSHISKSDYIIHLAALVGLGACDVNKRNSWDINLNGTKKILEYLSPSQRVLFGSTGSNYGKATGLIDETAPLNPLTVYAKSKAEAEKIVSQCSSEWIAYRFATAFGVSPRMRYDLLVNDLTKKALRDGYFLVYEPEFKRTFIHVFDVARSFVFAIENWEKAKCAIYNVGDEKMNRTKGQIAELIAEKTNAVVEYKDFDNDKDKRDYALSFEKIKNIGFECEISIENGIDDLLSAYALTEWHDQTINASCLS